MLFGNLFLDKNPAYGHIIMSVCKTIKIKAVNKCCYILQQINTGSREPPLASGYKLPTNIRSLILSADGSSFVVVIHRRTDDTRTFYQPEDHFTQE